MIPQAENSPRASIATKDDDQYELVEYACHEANDGMTNILSGARAQEKAHGAAKK